MHEIEQRQVEQMKEIEQGTRLRGSGVHGAMLPVTRANQPVPQHDDSGGRTENRASGVYGQMLPIRQETRGAESPMGATSPSDVREHSAPLQQPHGAERAFPSAAQISEQSKDAQLRGLQRDLLKSRFENEVAKHDRGMGSDGKPILPQRGKR